MENQKLEFKLNKRKLKFSQKRYTGFTLIEMAIVLVIIGLIIGAVLKGQDLIDNARAKKFANFIRQAEIAQWTFFDRHGHFAGDDDTNGLIGTTADDVATNGRPTAGDDQAFEHYDFSDTLNLGSSTFHIRFGQFGAGSARPVIVVTTSENAVPADPGNKLNHSESEWCRSFDTAIDGQADPTLGKVIAYSTGAAFGTYTGQDTFTMTGADPDGNYTTAGQDPDILGCVYFFADNGILN